MIARPSHELKLRSEIDIEKLIAFIRVCARDVRFVVEHTLIDRVLARLEAYARENQGRVVLEIVLPDGTTLLQSAVAGALVGAAVGGAVAGIPGAVVGAVGGAVVGSAAACVRVTLHLGRDGGPAALVLA